MVVCVIVFIFNQWLHLHVNFRKKDRTISRDDNKKRLTFHTGISTNTMKALPLEIVLDILSRLPTSSLLTVKLVCRSWRRLAQDPSFISFHFNRMTEHDPSLILHCDSPVRNQLSALYLYAHNQKAGFVRKINVPEMPEFQVVGSCNGLICLCDVAPKNTFFIFNPFTGDCIEQPAPNQNSDVWSVFGFGFHPRTEEYKIMKFDHVARYNTEVPIRNRPRHHLRRRTKVEILTVGSNSWRNLGEIPHHPIESKPQVLINGRLHWVSWPERYRPGRLLLSFDLEDEQFREIPRPDSPDLMRRGYSLLVLRGCISAAYHGRFAQFDIWVMKEYGVRESWVQEFRIGIHVPRGLEQSVAESSFKDSKFYNNRSLTRVLCGLKNGEILLEYKCRVLVCYDPRSDTFRDIEVEGMPNWFVATTHTVNV